MNKSLMALALAAGFGVAQAQVTVTATGSGTTLINALLAPGSGLTIDAGSIGYLGTSTQGGTYTGFSFAGGLANGIVLTSGAASAGGSNSSSGFGVNTGGAGDATIAAMTGLSSFDANALSFSFTAGAGITSVSANFRYASEEYPEYSGTQFGDGFAFVVDGVNYAKFQNGAIVSLKDLGNNVNMIDNTGGIFPTQYDGFTPALTVTGLLNPALSTHTIKIVVSDTGDRILDSAAFVTGLTTGQITGGGGITPQVPEPGTWALMLAGLAVVGGVARRQRRHD